MWLHGKDFWFFFKLNLIQLPHYIDRWSCQEEDKGSHSLRGQEWQSTGGGTSVSAEGSWFWNQHFSRERGCCMIIGLHFWSLHVYTCTHTQGLPCLLYDYSYFPCGWTLGTAYRCFPPCFFPSRPWTQFSTFPKYWLVQCLKCSGNTKALGYRMGITECVTTAQTIIFNWIDVGSHVPVHWWVIPWHRAFFPGGVTGCVPLRPPFNTSSSFTFPMESSHLLCTNQSHPII